MLPLRLDGGRLAGTRPDPLVDTAKLILEVVPGERWLLPEFGCRIHLLQRLDSAADRHVGAALVEEALTRWAPDLRVDRAEVLAVDGRRIEVALRAGGLWHHLEITHRNPVAMQDLGRAEPGPPASLARRARTDMGEEGRPI
jgi:phage baseplate assembly protein W